MNKKNLDLGELYSEWKAGEAKMKNKLELQKQYIEVKKKYDELYDEFHEKFYDLTYSERVYLHNQIKDTFTLLKSLNKQIYYEG